MVTAVHKTMGRNNNNNHDDDDLERKVKVEADVDDHYYGDCVGEREQGKEEH